MAKTIFASNELGSRITIVATHDISRGEIVSINGIIGVATNPIRTGKSGTLLTEGIFEVEKIDSEMELLVGSNVYLQYGLATNVQNMTYLGKVVEDSDPGETSVRIKISTGTQNSIVSLTLAELETLAFNSELNKGLQYDVTDKGWLVYALSPNLCRLLTLNVKEILPPYILREGSPISLTLAELQELQFTDAPAPTGITITPDAVGDNPVTWYGCVLSYSLDSKRTLISEEVEFIVGDDTDEIQLNCESLFFYDAILLIGTTPGNIPLTHQLSTGFSRIDLPLVFTGGVGNFDGRAEFVVDFQVQKAPLPLPIGQQYYVTDKEWLLYVDKPTVLKPVSGSIHLFNGQELPEGIEPDKLIIDTGIMTDNYEDPRLTINVPDGYLFNNFFVNFLGGSVEGQFAFTANGNILYRSTPSDGIGLYLSKQIDVDYEKHIAPFEFQAVGNSAPGFRALINFSKSNLYVPIPIPQILSAETSEDGYVIRLTFNSNIYGRIEPNTQLPDVTSALILKVNGEEVANAGVGFFPDFPDNIILMAYDVAVLFGDTLTMSLPSLIKNVWGGLLPEVIDYPVTNNVPAPLTLLLAETDTDGTKLILTFNKDMSDQFPEYSSEDFNTGAYSYASINIGTSPNKVELIPYEIITSDMIDDGLRFNGNTAIMALDGTVLASFENFPVINNLI